jgi:hypothetical protein
MDIDSYPSVVRNRLWRKVSRERTSLPRYVTVTNQRPKARDPIEQADRRCYLNYALAESTWLSAGHQGNQRSPGGMAAGSGTGGISAGSWIAGISEGSVTVGIAEGNWTAGMSLGSWTAGTSAGKGNGGMLAGSGRSGSGRTEKLDGSGIVGGAG